MQYCTGLCTADKTIKGNLFSCFILYIKTNMSMFSDNIYHIFIIWAPLEGEYCPPLCVHPPGIHIPNFALYSSIKTFTCIKHIIWKLSMLKKCSYDIKSKSLKMKVFSISNPHAMMSLVFSNAMWLACSRVRSFHRYFSSSVSCMTSGTSKVSCNHL